MKTMNRDGQAVIICKLLLAVFAGLVLGGTVVAGEAAGAGAFASDLLQKHGYLLTETEQANLSRIHRRLREAEQRIRQAPDEASRRAADVAGDKAVQALTELLQDCPTVRRVPLSADKLAPALEEPFALPGETGAILLCLEADGEGVRFVTQNLNQSRPEHSGTIGIDCAGEGTTWVLLGFHQLPVRRTTFPVELQVPGQPALRASMDVVTPEQGTLAVTILDDDSGKPMPAMIRITSLVTGEDQQPSNAIDFGPQFDGNGRPTGHRPANLPGRFGGEWWCVPEPFTMSLSPGAYRIETRRGVEHLLDSAEVHVRSGECSGVVFRPKRWVDMRHLGWYSGDDHVHGRILSDGDADRLMAWVQAEDIRVANVVKMGDIFRTWFDQRGWGPEFRVLDEGYILSPGQECPRTHNQIGHTLSMNTRGMIRDTDHYYLYDRVADEAHAQGGLFGYAHVNSGMFFVHRDMSINVPKGKIDFGEVLQFNQLGTDLWYQFLNTGFKFTASAGSDVPWGGTVGEVRLYAYLGEAPFTVDGWFEAVRMGRTFVTSGPMLEFRVDEALPGDEIEVADPDRQLRVTARAWGHPDRNLPRRLEVVRLGEVVSGVDSTPGQVTHELRVEFDLSAGNGFWIAARVWADDGTAAHTTPVYVSRKPLRFWKHAEAESLITVRLQSLNEVRQLVTEAQAREAAGGLAGDFTARQLALQGEALLQRVEEAERIYRDLLEVAKEEEYLRGQ